MRVLVTGPESSGTRWLAGLLAEAGGQTLHRSQPYGTDWLDLAAMLDSFDAVVVIVRGYYAQVESLKERLACGDPYAKRRKALRLVAPILADPKVHLVTYESMGSPVEVRHLLTVLGLDPDATVPFDDASSHRYAGRLIPDGWSLSWDDTRPVLVPA